jgi:methylmalonyl-CoA mutase cobalamin-binding subunit
MTKGKGFELIPRSVPMRQRSSFYKEIVNAFLASGEKSAVVSGTDRKPVTLVQGLRKVLQSDNITTVQVVQRGSDIYLVKD